MDAKVRDYLIANYAIETGAEIADKLRLTEGSVRTYATQLGLRKYYVVYDLGGEVWAVHPQYPAYYVSNKGRLKSKLRNRIQSSREHEGYLDCRIPDKEGKKRSPRVHRLVAELFVIKREGANFVNHIDGNKLNNVAENLEWVTQSENVIHANKMGLGGKRTDTLEITEVHDICRRIQRGETIKQVIRANPRYTNARVQHIRQRRRWTIISGEYAW